MRPYPRKWRAQGFVCIWCDDHVSQTCRLPWHGMPATRPTVQGVVATSLGLAPARSSGLQDRTIFAERRAKKISGLRFQDQHNWTMTCPRRKRMRGRVGKDQAYSRERLREPQHHTATPTHEMYQIKQIWLHMKHPGGMRPSHGDAAEARHPCLASHLFADECSFINFVTRAANSP